MSIEQQWSTTAVVVILSMLGSASICAQPVRDPDWGAPYPVRQPQDSLVTHGANGSWSVDDRLQRLEDALQHFQTQASDSRNAARSSSQSTISASDEVFQHPLEFAGAGILGPYHYDRTNRWLDFGILIQTEFLQNDPSQGATAEQWFFRRLRPTVMGGMNDWQGILQMDFGAGEDGTASVTTVRWVNFRYTGFHQAHVTFGSFKPWFSRELLTLGPHLQTIERSPVGDTNYGNPDYNIGIGWDRLLDNRQVAYYLSVGLQDHQQSVTQMQMRSPANAASGSNEGILVTGRLDYYPLGNLPDDHRPLHTPAQVAYNRGDFHTDAWRTIVSIAAYSWWNDGNSNPFTVNGVSTSTMQADLDQAFGAELSGGIRGFGVSADVEYQYVRGDLIDPAFTGGLYVNGRSNLNKFAVNAGYMLPNNVELVSGWSIIDATGFDRALSETKVGLNWYVMKYSVRFSTTHSFINNNDGVIGNNLGVTRALAQFVW